MLTQLGISQSMRFDFQGMIAGRVPFSFDISEHEVIAKNESDKSLITLHRTGEVTKNEVFIEGLIRSYVAFFRGNIPSYTG